MRAARQSSAHRRRLAAAEAPGTLSPPWRGGLGSGPPWGLGNEKQPTPCCALPFDCPGREAAGASPVFSPTPRPGLRAAPSAPVLTAGEGGTGTGEGLGGPRAVLAHPRCCKHLGWLQASSWVHPRARSWPRSPSLGEVLRQPGWKGEGRGSLGTESPPQVPPARGGRPRTPAGKGLSLHPSPPQHCKAGVPTLPILGGERAGFGEIPSSPPARAVPPTCSRAPQAHETAGYNTSIIPAHTPTLHM